MLAVNLIYVGDLKESYLQQAAAEYEKRLGAFCRLSQIKIKDEPLRDGESEATVAQAIKREGERILEMLPRGSNVALCVEGSQYSSPELAEKLSAAMAGGMSVLNLIIGGARGLSPEVKRVCTLKLSLSKMTFTHRMTRILVLEGLYRSFSIISGSKYHK